ncbi:MAG: kelch repeat-containing protein, partial [Kangiellaceae bacterium]|nr:kelch repeat-containing protein [Kangiellaceae bacterium]
GGYNGSSWHDKCEKISIENFNSVPIASLNCRRCAFSSAVTNNFIYVFGGYDGSKYLDNIERYNVAYDKWEVLPCVLHRPL